MLFRSHKVRKGETLATIARQYDCSSAEIKKWNKLKKSSVYRGQALKIYVQSQQPAVHAKTPKTVPSTQDVAVSTDPVSEDQTVAVVEKKPAGTTVNAKYHLVKKGESLGKVASKYNVTMNDLKAWNKLKSTNVIIGQKIRVNAPGKTASNESQAGTTEKENPKQTTLQKQVLANAKYHVVQKGEFLNKIATTYGVTTDELVSWNSLETNNLLVGQKLRVNQPDTGSNAKNLAQETPEKGQKNNDKDLKLV